MTVECPCGCGRTIKRSLHRTAEHGVFLASLSQVPDHLARVRAEYDWGAGVHMEEFALTGLAYSNAMLHAAHETPHAFGLPAPKDVDEWEAAALKLVHTARQVDPSGSHGGAVRFGTSQPGAWIGP